MTTITINCLDKISLAFDEKNYFVSFTILEKYKYNSEKIKEFCIHKINDSYNPKYPFFFIKINDIIQSIDCSTDILNNTINVELFAKKHLLYKLKIIGLCDNPVYCLCLDTYTFIYIINMLYTKYPICYSGIFFHNNKKIEINVPIKKFNFFIDEINEINCIAGNNNNITFST